MSSNISDRTLTAGFIAVGLLTIGLWNFSQLFGLDFNTGAEVIIGLIPVAAVWALLRYATPIPFRDTWPLALAALWVCGWPALDYWADYADAGAQQLWYATWYVQWGGLVAIVALGYATRARLNGSRVAGISDDAQL